MLGVKVLMALPITFSFSGFGDDLFRYPAVFRDRVGSVVPVRLCSGVSPGDGVAVVVK